MHAGHVEVQQNQIQVVLFPGYGQSTIQVAGFQQLAAGKSATDDIADGLAKQRMIISYQYLVHGLGNLFLLYLVMPGNAGPVVSVGITPPEGRLANDTFAQRTGTKVLGRAWPGSCKP